MARACAVCVAHGGAGRIVLCSLFLHTFLRPTRPSLPPPLPLPSLPPLTLPSLPSFIPSLLPHRRNGSKRSRKKCRRSAAIWIRPGATTRRRTRTVRRRCFRRRGGLVCCWGGNIDTSKGKQATTTTDEDESISTHNKTCYIIRLVLYKRPRLQAAMPSSDAPLPPLPTLLVHPQSSLSESRSRSI